ncbi:MAG: beta-propeller domain-containing protein [Polyangiaceae bacterium]
MSRSFLSLATVGALAAASSMLPACSGGSSSGDPSQRISGQSSFQSAPPVGQSGGSSESFGAAGGDSAGVAPTNGGSKSAATGSSTQTRNVQETDLYRLEGNKLYYLNSYRGLMVFDVTNVDQPKLLGRSAIFGTPIDMVVNNGVAVVVVADWYGTMTDGTPFHGSIVRGLDATDPTNIKSIGDAYLGGNVTDTRVVGNVLYAVSQDYGWEYGDWDTGGYYPGGGGVAVSNGASGVGGTVGSGSSAEKVIVSSVSFAGNIIKQKGYQEFSGYSAIFNVTPNSILLAHDIPSDPTQPYSEPSGNSVLQYIDISDPGGTIKLRGSIQASGSVQGWGADNGRWNVDFADGKVGHLLACNGTYCDGTAGYTLTTADFTNPDAPKLASSLNVPGAGWSVATRFDSGRMYLSPSDGYYDTTVGGTPLEIFDLSNPAAPTLAGQTNLSGNVWLLMPNGNQLFALGNASTTDYSSTQVSLSYIDVTNPKAPAPIGSPANFGNGWAWTPAADTFKAFIKDDAQGLVVLPFSGWDYNSYAYNNGVQLISYSPTSISTSGAAHTSGWVERGIFVNGRIVSLSDMSLSVIDYSDRLAPKVVTSLTLARNVVSAKPNGGTIAELSSDWWENDSSNSELRILPTANAGETTDTSGAVTAKLNGVDARAFNNGNLSYVVTQVPAPVDCGNGDGPSTPSGQCTAYVPQVQVVDLSNGGAAKRGSVTLPVEPNSNSWWGWGWGGFYYYDWYDGSDTVQIGNDMLAFRRWFPVYDGKGSWTADQQLYIVDLSNPDHPSISSTLITPDSRSWWGNMRAIGDTLYTSHYEWVTFPSEAFPNGIVRYYLDRIDLSDRAHPKVGSKINVPGMLVGASSTDPTELYTIDYRWDGDIAKNDIDVVKIDGNKAYLQGSVRVEGWVGNVFVQNNTAYTSTEKYVESGSAYDPNAGPLVNLHQIDLSNPSAPTDRATTPTKGWGWLLGVEGDRAILTSGWGSEGVDIYKLAPNAVPSFDQTVRTNGWWTESLSRQDNQLFLSSGYWGVQTVTLNP